MKKVIFTEKAPAAIGPYSQAVEVNGMVFLSGQIPVDPATGEFVPGGVTEQTIQVFENKGQVDHRTVGRPVNIQVAVGVNNEHGIGRFIVAHEVDAHIAEALHFGDKTRRAVGFVDFHDGPFGSVIDFGSALRHRTGALPGQMLSPVADLERRKFGGVRLSNGISGKKETKK